ncbi:MAG: nuclear transport factor 2 family protein [Candidatus Bipolaricaulota bacterium]|nr:nuclear transport factor 2 family protein [Candidatus Bipolaricaulota bacterium]
MGKATSMTAENLIYKDVEELGEFGPEEKKALAVVLEELRAWDRHDLQKLYSLCDKDIVYHDITLPPAKGLEGMKAFGRRLGEGLPGLHRLRGAVRRSGEHGGQCRPDLRYDDRGVLRGAWAGEAV